MGGREMSDTPETDAEGYGDGRHPYVATEFARNLERERDEARVELAALKQAIVKSRSSTTGWIDCAATGEDAK